MSDSSFLHVALTRLQTNDEGTFGRLNFNGFTCYSGELPDRNNQPNVSNIPSGKYKCIWSYSARFRKKMYEITNVQGRAGIRIHSANLMGDDTKGWKRQLNGCVALGERLGTIDGQKALLLSKPAIRQFEDLLKGRDFILEIK